MPHFAMSATCYRLPANVVLVPAVAFERENVAGATESTAAIAAHAGYCTPYSLDTRAGGQ